MEQELTEWIVCVVVVWLVGCWRQGLLQPRLALIRCVAEAFLEFQILLSQPPVGCEPNPDLPQEVSAFNY